MTYSQLKIFVAIAEIGNLTKAAKKLGITQSAASSALAKLERLNRLKLFKRNGRALILSEVGEQFLPAAKHALKAASDASHILTHLSGSVAGELKIAASQTIANYWLPKKLAKFQTIYPEIKLRVSISNTVGVENSLINDLAQIGLIEGNTSNGLLEISHVEYDQPMLVVAKDKYQQSNLPITRVAIEQIPWVVREPGSGTRAILETLLETQKISWNNINVALELPSNEAIRQAVEAGAGFTIISKYVVDASIDNGTLTTAPLQIPKRSFQLVSKKDQERTDAHKAFTNFLKGSP